MAKMTLLEMVQDILNDMDSDEVSSIDDTTESIQVAQIVKTAYFKLLTARDDWPFLRTLTSFNGLSDLDNPTKMEMPESLNKVYWVKYNKKPVDYLDPEQFKHMLDTRTELADVVDSDGYIINADPRYWTTYDDNEVVFDGYDSDVDSTLQESKSDVYAIVMPLWVHEDSAVPAKLPEKMFPTLLADAKGTAFLTLKQQANSKEENYAQKGRVRFQNASFRADSAETKSNTGINYGRK